MKKIGISVIQKMKFEYKIAIGYFIIGFLWIFLSDTFFDNLINEQMLTKVHILKGTFYVIVTSVLLFYFIKKHLNILHKVELLAKQKSEEFEVQYEEYKRINIELQKAKEKAEENENKLEEAQSLAHIGSWELNLVNNKLTWSDEIYRIFGCNPQEFGATYDAFLNFIHPDDRDFVNNSYQNHINSKVPYDIVHRILLPNNEVKYVNERCKSDFDAQGKPLRSVGTVADITVKIVADEALLRTQHSIDSITDSIFWIDKTARVVFANQAACRNLEYSIEELLALKIFDFDPVFPQEKWEEHWQEIFLTGSFVMETVHRTKSGRQYPVELTTNKMEFSGIQYNCAIARDITYRKVYEHQLIEEKEKAEENEKKISAITNQASEGIALADFDGKYVYVNPALCKMTGYSETELLKMSVFDLRANSQTKGVFNESITTREGLPIQVILRRKDGTEFYTEIVGSIIKINNQNFVLGTVRDITERKQLEEANFKAQQVFRTLVENSPDIIARYDLNCQRTYVNPVYLRVAQIPQQELISTAPVQCSPLPAESALLLQNLLCKVITTGIAEAIDVIWQKADNMNYWYNINANPEYDREGKVMGVITISRDITIRKQAEFLLKEKNSEYLALNEEYISINRILNQTNQELLIAKEKAEESDRLKTAFLQNMSHEIRTPMNGILGFSELLKVPGLTGDQQQEYIEFIEKSGARMLNIISEIVDISKIEAGQMEVRIQKTNINNDFEDVYNILKVEADKKGINLTFKSSLLFKEAYISTDREKLHSVLTNLVNNAIKYTDKGSVDFGCDKIDINSKPYIRFFVKDTGIGIPGERQDAIFERFVQADIVDKCARQGAGLGLSIAKACVEMLEGRIWVESEVGKGSAFYFTLPYHTELEEKIIVQNILPSVNEYNHIRNLKVLIAEDDVTSEMLLLIYIKEFNMRVIKARTGEETIEACRNNRDIDLILMDIQMPGINGYDATRQIRCFNEEVVIIAQTAFAQKGDYEKAIAAGCNDHISKPFNKDRLLKLIQRYFNQ